ncbi:outer membrane protein assembly factor BamD [Acinetobacter sp. A3.8]|uniref:Outer membrane protein assembly factor BamD n=1 Tax=Acinetobacter sedimenti TaxID=2919922 RepID=A0A9X1WXV6_9GAMM|nr:YbgF trimerization domain-containing protein [Acinetobacter sedimenti]MCJ8147139.1 outer membrane protein assembly factor BamD [Acinetobacter sedimenti]
MKKITLLASAMFAQTLSHAAPIEQRNLSTPTATVAPAQQSTQLWDLRQTVGQLQNQIRDLRGQIEEQNNQIEQMENELKNRYTDLDQRLELLNQKVDANDGSELEDLDGTADDNSPNNNSPESKVPTPPSANPKTPVENNLPTQKQTQIPQAQTQQSKAPLTDKEAYNLAYDAYQKGGAASAIPQMENFIQLHPTSAYVSNAYYWLGEFNLSLTPPNFNQAKDNFEIVAGNYPTSSKAPASLFRLSQIAKNVDQDIPRAREYYLKLIQNYDGSEEARRARTEIDL